MASTGRATTQNKRSGPKKSELPAPQVQEFRSLFNDAKRAKDEDGRTISSSRWGIYAFFDYDGEPIYVGQTNEQLSTRLNRHLTNQRTDAVAMRILDVFEVAEVMMWPIWDLQSTPRTDKEACRRLDAYEYSAYLKAIEDSKFGAILNEKIPPKSNKLGLPPGFRFSLISEKTRLERGHPDVRIARRAETISRLAAVAHERGEVSEGLRRVVVIQAVRLAYLSAVRLAIAEGRPTPDPRSISVEGLVGSVFYELGAPSEENYSNPSNRQDDYSPKELTVRDWLLSTKNRGSRFWEIHEIAARVDILQESGSSGAEIDQVLNLNEGKHLGIDPRELIKQDPEIVRVARSIIENEEQFH